MAEKAKGGKIRLVSRMYRQRRSARQCDQSAQSPLCKLILLFRIRVSRQLINWFL
jgi:hypothetical protein